MARSRSLGELQLAIMRVLWNAGEASIAEVHAALEPDRHLAPTTIATMLAKMERKGVVGHRAEGRRFIYVPRVTESQVRRSMVSELTDRLFEGHATELVSHLLETGSLDRREIQSLKVLIASHEKKGGR